MPGLSVDRRCPCVPSQPQAPQKLGGTDKLETFVSTCLCLLHGTLWPGPLSPNQAPGPFPGRSGGLSQLTTNHRSFGCRSDQGWGFWLGWCCTGDLNLSRGWGAWGGSPAPAGADFPPLEGHTGNGPHWWDLRARLIPGSLMRSWT